MSKIVLIILLFIIFVFLFIKGANVNKKKRDLKDLTGKYFHKKVGNNSVLYVYFIDEYHQISLRQASDYDELVLKKYNYIK